VLHAALIEVMLDTALGSLPFTAISNALRNASMEDTALGRFPVGDRTRAVTTIPERVELAPFTRLVLEYD
jgi:hypothetical protein